MIPHHAVASGDEVQTILRFADLGSVFAQHLRSIMKAGLGSISLGRACLAEAILVFILVRAHAFVAFLLSCWLGFAGFGFATWLFLEYSELFLKMRFLS